MIFESFPCSAIEGFGCKTGKVYCLVTDSLCGKLGEGVRPEGKAWFSRFCYLPIMRPFRD